jgi:hypothetical protein
METTTAKILEWIEILKTKPQTLISLDAIDYETLRIYVEGYLDGMDEALNVNLMKKMTCWYQQRVCQRASVYWTSHIKQLHAGKPDGERISILLDTMKDFFLQNQCWYEVVEDTKIPLVEL